MLGTETYVPDVNGAAHFTEQLATGLAARGHEVHVLCPAREGKASADAERGVIVHRLPSHRYPKHETLQICMPWEVSRPITSLVGQVKPDVIHVQSHMLVGRLLARAARRTATPLIATNHFMPENVVGYLPVPRFAQRWVASWSWRDLGRVFSQADAVTAPTPRAVELLHTSTSLTGAQAISCGVDTARFWTAAQSATAHDVPTVLFVGRLDPEKRVDELIRAFASMPATLPAQLEIVGDGERRAEWIALAEELGTTDRVAFRGFVSDEELLQAYAQSDIFCMPGVAELQSLVTLEAMSAGKPVIAADAMALPHLVHPGRNGWLYQPGDVGELALRLSTLISDAKLRHRMGTAGRQIVAQHAQESTLDRFEDLYRRVRLSPVTQVSRAVAGNQGERHVA